ncbi:MAG: hypothetical protein S4CHLAM45_04050 [Chlamydiales bacterium]|nr:hypothetical protein [Chlamydiales bacterium]MCH9619259.1 hypothetical protein [Chlamydiales bacterium]MCH9622521.1 hypothetical protein [Chlamydiales bacterium]
MIFDALSNLDALFWGYIAFVLIMVLGVLLSLQMRFAQVFHLPSFFKTFFHSFEVKESGRGVHPIRAFFASTGGMIGIGNVVGIATAVQLGGPGALMWVWIAGIIGAIVKYSEIYLGFKYRVENRQGGYDGGPMYFLKKAFKWSWIPAFISILLCIYGVEIYQFSVITESISTNWHINRLVVITVLLMAVLWASYGGVARIGKICSWVVPLFLVIYLAMGFWIILHEVTVLPALLAVVVKSAFTGHAAVGGFAGGGMILAVQHGIARAAYSADIGVGYDSIIQSESRATHPEHQAKLAILGVFIDNVICTITILTVLLTGVWTMSAEGSSIIQAAFGHYFPYMNIFLPFFYIVTGYTTLIAYFCVGIKCATFLLPNYGARLYFFFGSTMLLLFSFLPQSQALLVMSVCGALLLIFNLLGIFRLRKEIGYLSETKLAINS